MKESVLLYFISGEAFTLRTTDESEDHIQTDTGRHTSAGEGGWELCARPSASSTVYLARGPTRHDTIRWRQYRDSIFNHEVPGNVPASILPGQVLSNGEARSSGVRPPAGTTILDVEREARTRAQGWFGTWLRVSAGPS